MAQYRAIFKRAYIKGIASAILLTAGLAAGQAQAAATEYSGAATWEEASKLDPINVSAEESTILGGINNKKAFYNDLTIKSGATASTSGDVYVKGTMTVEKGATLKVNTTKGKGGNLFGHYTVNGTLDSTGRLENRGTINATSTDDFPVVEFHSVHLYDGSETTLGGVGTQAASNWGQSSMLGAGAGVADGTNNFTIDKGAKLNLQDYSHAYINQNASMAIDGEVTLTASGDGSFAIIRGCDNYNSTNKFSTDKNAVITIGENAAITAAKGSGSTGIFAPDVTIAGSSDAKAPATITVQNGSTFTLDGDMAESNKGFSAAAKGAGQFKMTSGKINVAEGGTLIIGNGSYEDIPGNDVDESAITTLDIQGGELTGAGTVQLEGKLTVSVNTIKAFLNGKDSAGNQNDGNFVFSGDKTRFEVTGSEQFDLAQYSFSGSGTTDFVLTDSGTIAGENLAVSHKLTQTGKADGAAAGVSDNLTLEATNLTLGSSSAKSPTESLGFKSATARNLTVLASDGAFKLYDDVTLRSISGTDNVVASDGTIEGDLAITSGKTFTVDGGIYQTNDDFTVNASGSLAVTNTKGANQSSLDLNRGINFNLSSSGEAKVTVNGGLTAEYQAGSETLGKLTQLDLRDGISASGSTGTAKISATSGGVVLVDGNDLTAIFAAAGSADNALSKVSFEVASGAALKADGNVKMSFTDSNASTLNNMLVLKEKGIFEADSLNIEAKFSSYEKEKQGLGFTDATVRVGSLSFTNNTTGADDSFLTGGTFEISNSLTVGNTLPLTLAASDVVAGEGDVTLKFDTGSNTATGTISAEDITNASANGKIIVAQGAWTATRTDFNLSNGTMTVGEAGSQDTASLTAYELSLSGGGSFNVAASVGSATFDHLDAWWTDGVNVAGTLTIKGDDVTVETEDNPVAVHTNTNSINVASTGTLTFESKAVYNAIFGGTSGDEVLLKDSFAENTIDLEANGHVSLAFNNTTALSAKQIVDLKKKLFNNDTEGSILGFINLGDAKIEDLKFGTDDNGTPTITWDQLQPVADVVGAGTGNNELAQAKVTDISSSAQFKSPVGSVVSTDGSVTVAGNSSFNNAAGNNGLFVSDTSGKVGNATVDNGSDLQLNGSGEIGTVSLNGGSATDQSVLVTGNGSSNAPAKVTIASIKGDNASAFSSRAAETAVTGDVDVGSMETLANTVTTVDGDVTVSDTSGTASFAGTTDIKGNAEFAGKVDFSGITTFGGNVEITGDANVTGNTTATAGDTSLSGNMTIAKGAAFTANSIKLDSAGTQVLAVGTETTTDENGEEQPGTTGYLDVTTLSLNGNTLVVDPDYGEATSIAAIDDFDASGHADDISAIHGTVIVGQNAALMVGAGASKQAMSEFIERYQKGVSLDKDNVGAVVYLTSAQTVDANNSRIIIDSTRSRDAILGTNGELNAADSDYSGKDAVGNSHKADLYIGKNSVLAIDEKAMTVNGAVHFDKDSAYIKGEAGSKVVLVGDSFLNSRNITLFTDNGTPNGETNGVYVMDNDIRVESLNGLMYFYLEKGKETQAQELQFDTTKADSAFNGASSPMRNFLLSYATRTVNYNEHYSDPTKVERVYLLDGADKSLATASGPDTVALTDKATELGLTADDFVVRNVGTKDKPEYVAYRLANNQFLEKVVRDTDGGAADEAARMGAFGGAAQAALMAASTTTDAIAGRMGMGLTNAAFTASDNGQGAGLWLTPIYKNSDSDGFEADGLSYGADVDLYGVSLGGDYTLANGLRIGAMFNVGSGEADGQGDASNVTNDFNYYGFGLYAGYSMGDFSIVGDVSYSVVDSDVDASTQVEKVTTSFDTAALSVGVTAQYSLDLNGFAVVPHAGLRYTSLDMDDYDLDGADSGNIGNFDADTAGIFSIPVGVTVAKEFTSESWTVKPALDLTLTGNFGDDTLDGEVNWNGVSNRNVATESEIVDNFTYSAALGVAAQNGNFSFGLGVNYTGSSNVDEFGVNANARFTF